MGADGLGCSLSHWAKVRGPRYTPLGRRANPQDLGFEIRSRSVFGNHTESLVFPNLNDLIEYKVLKGIFPSAVVKTFN